MSKTESVYFIRRDSKREAKQKLWSLNKIKRLPMNTEQWLGRGILFTFTKLEITVKSGNTFICSSYVLICSAYVGIQLKGTSWKMTVVV